MKSYKTFRPIILIFLALNAMFVVFSKKFDQMGFDRNLMILGNLLLFIVTIISFFMLNNGMKAKGTASFIGSVYGSFILKVIILAISVFIYAKSVGKGINKPAIFGLMFLYLVYTFMEIRTIMKISKN
ncbi:MAG: hypothetical protein ACO29O_09005 [Chitinophagaceae bacterium]